MEKDKKLRAEKIIIEKINQTFQKNLSKMIVSLFFVLIINSFISAFVLNFAMLSGSSLSLLILGLSIFLSVFLYYGFSHILGNFYQGKRTIIGDLFVGKQDIKRLVFITLGIIALEFSVVFVFLLCIISYGIKRFDIFTQEGLVGLSELTMNYLPYFAMGFLIVMILIGIPRAMLFPTMLNNPELSFTKAMKESRKLLKGKVFKFIWFCVKVGKLPLIITLVSFVIDFFINNSVISSVLGFVTSISSYYLLIYVILSINAYYYELTAKEEEFLGIEDVSGSLENQEILESEENLEKTENSSEEEECLSLPEA